MSPCQHPLRLNIHYTLLVAMFNTVTLQNHYDDATSRLDVFQASKMSHTMYLHQNDMPAACIRIYLIAKSPVKEQAALRLSRHACMDAICIHIQQLTIRLQSQSPCTHEHCLHATSHRQGSSKQAFISKPTYDTSRSICWCNRLQPHWLQSSSPSSQHARTAMSMHAMQQANQPTTIWP